MKFDIRERTKKFGIRAIKLVKNFPKDVSGQVLGKQFIRSATSVGANLEEADAASSRKDFFYKASISYREIRESRFWLEVVIGAELLIDLQSTKEAEILTNEAVELSKILYSIINSKNKAQAVDSYDE